MKHYTLNSKELDFIAAMVEQANHHYQDDDSYMALELIRLIKEGKSERERRLELEEIMLEGAFPLRIGYKRDIVDRIDQVVGTREKSRKEKLEEYICEREKYPWMHCFGNCENCAVGRKR